MSWVIVCGVVALTCLCVLPECMYLCVEQSENIKLDPELNSACKDDVHRFCAKTHPGNAAVSYCLNSGILKIHIYY